MARVSNIGRLDLQGSVMVELLVMRHAKSAWDTGDTDFDRPLSARGVRNADQMARWLVDNELEPDRILSSAAVRTRTTAMTVMFECAVERARVDFDDQLYLAGLFDWLFVVQKQESERLLICGHNPGLDDLVEYLSSDLPAFTESGKLMTTGAVAHFEFEVAWPDVAARSGRLVQLIRPRELPEL